MEKLRDRFTLAGSRALALRKNMTDAEKLLWSRLRRNQMHAFKFRRQAPIGPYIADFICIEAGTVIEICIEAGTVIELDGGKHAKDKDHDDRRDAYMSSRGYRVLRFWNNDVVENLNGVLETISSALAGRSDGT